FSPRSFLSSSSLIWMTCLSMLPELGMTMCWGSRSPYSRQDMLHRARISSSAAIEVASALALISLNGAVFPLVEVAKLCQHTENAFIGARVGIMDQFVSCLGRAGHALLLDCRSLEFELIPVPDRVRMVVCN